MPENDDRDGFADEYLNRKQAGQTKRKNNIKRKGDGGKKIHKVGASKDRWQWNKHESYEEESE